MLVTVFHQRSTVAIIKQRRLDQSRPIADASAREMAKLVEREWSQISESDLSSNRRGGGTKTPPRGTSNRSAARLSPSYQFPSLVAETGILRSPSQTPVNMGPREIFSSDAWKSRISKFLGTDARARRRVALVQYKVRVAICVLLLYFGIVVGINVLLLIGLPTVYSSTTVRSFTSVLLFNSRLLSSVVSSATTWIDFLVLADMIVEFVFLLFWSAIVIQWPQLQVKISHIVRTRNAIRRGAETDFGQAAADGAIYADTVCAVILVRESCTSDSRRQSLVKRIQNLLTMFPPDSVFVVDSNGYSVVPVDNTWEIVNSISPLIRYCFVPDCESKLFALNWFNTVWLPFLCRSGQSQPFSHFLVISSLGDDSPLPAVPLDISLPRENISLNMDSLRSIHIPVTAVSCSSITRSCMIVPCQDFDFKFRAIGRLAESKIATCTETELCVSVWERDALFSALEGTVSNDVYNGNEQMRTGLEVVKMRGRNHTCSNPFTFVPVAVPTSFSELVSANVRNGNGAGNGAKLAQAVREFVSVFSLCNIQSLTLKPALLLLVFLGGLIQITRPFVIGTLVYRDCISIGTLAGTAAVILFLREIILFLVYAGRPDLRQKWTASPILLYPAYRTIMTWFIEVPALYEYVFGGCVSNTSLKPKKRTQELSDIPACPPCHAVNWYTVWKMTESFDEEDDMNDRKHMMTDEELSTGFPSPSGSNGNMRRLS